MTALLLSVLYYTAVLAFELPRLVRHKKWRAVTAVSLLSTAGLALLCAYGLGFRPEGLVQPAIEYGHRLLQAIGLGAPFTPW